MRISTDDKRGLTPMDAGSHHEAIPRWERQLGRHSRSCLGAGKASRWLRGASTDLRRSGYMPGDAVAHAEHTDIDLHQPVQLPSPGCPQQTALRILL